ncbi:OLC1v1030978C1 [Oldenlandia corymbosa var. corymbosa]|uniref:OLC1v1030978C1 n=1 Tax=Oldenlandia corymbosa var. corymbosa TaxID=529605 RepID=A0AAV1CKT1_OLDCO|nr:OLC1v1030978C1 [Oldenlandia corymbosa var. corymbosa]
MGRDGGFGDARLLLCEGEGAGCCWLSRREEAEVVMMLPKKEGCVEYRDEVEKEAAGEGGEGLVWWLWKQSGGEDGGRLLRVDDGGRRNGKNEEGETRRAVGVVAGFPRTAQSTWATGSLLMGIFDNKVLLGVASRFWSSSSIVFCFPWGFMTPTLLNVAVITCVPVVADVTIDGDNEGADAAQAGSHCNNRELRVAGIKPLGNQSLCLSVTHTGVARYDSKFVAKVLWDLVPNLSVILKELSYKHWHPTFRAQTQVETELGDWDDDSASGRVEEVIVIVARQLGLVQGIPFFDVSCKHTWDFRRGKMTILEYYEQREIMANRCHSGKLVPFEVLPEASVVFYLFLEKVLRMLYPQALDGILQDVLPIDSDIPKPHVVDEQAPQGTKKTATNSSKKLVEMVDLFAEESNASDNKQASESVDEDATSSPEQHVSPPPKRQPGSRMSQRSVKQTSVTAAIPTIEELQQRLFYKKEETTPVVKTSGDATQSVGAALRELQGLSKINAEQVHAKYHQSLKQALETIQGSELPEAVKATVALFLANFQQRKINCEICVKHGEDYNHSAMAHLEAEKTAKTLVEQAATTTAQAKELAAKEAALEENLKNVREQC